jgi:putative transcriptional regulator
MSNIQETKSDIFAAVHETASGLFAQGYIDKRNMLQYDALCLAQVPRYQSQQIKAIRERLQVSQAVLASLINISLSTVRQWEIGAKKPNGASAKLLNLLDRKGIEAVL